MISGYITGSMIEWYDKISLVIFMSGCNWRCAFCHNYPLFNCKGNIFEKEMLDIIKEKVDTNFYDGVVLSGGEPTLHYNLVHFISQIKKMTKVKLHTNGSYPETIETLLERNLLDCLTLDYKTNIDNLNEVTGVKIDYKDAFTYSLDLLNNCNIEKEVHTTLVPKYVNQETIHKIGKTLTPNTKWFLQNFQTNNAFQLDILGNKVYNTSELDELKTIAKNYVESVILV